VREEAIAWHRDVRRALARGLRTVAETKKDPAGAADRLVASAAGIAAVVRRQVAAESAILRPILEHLDAWGPLRAAKLDALHEREQQALAKALAGGDGAVLASSLEGSIREILRALRIEEKELLDADLLDDSTTVARTQSSG
jgi:hypothetical protein